MGRSRDQLTGDLEMLATSIEMQAERVSRLAWLGDDPHRLELWAIAMDLGRIQGRERMR